MTKYIKSRTWGIVVYPESAPENWLELIEETYLAFAVSPLHDKDVNPDGEIKKSHWHVILTWDGPVTQSAANKLADKISAPQPIKLESVKGAYRYFTHKDNPEKYQYDEKEIRLFNGFDISNHIALTKEEKYEALSRIIDIIENKQFVEYYDLVLHLRTVDYTLYKVACDNTNMLTAMLRSVRHKTRR